MATVKLLSDDELSSEARAVFIPNTLELTTLWVTKPLETEVASRPGLEFETEFGVGQPVAVHRVEHLMTQ